MLPWRLRAGLAGFFGFPGAPFRVRRTSVPMERLAPGDPLLAPSSVNLRNPGSGPGGGFHHGNRFPFPANAYLRKANPSIHDTVKVHGTICLVQERRVPPAPFSVPLVPGRLLLEGRVPRAVRFRPRGSDSIGKIQGAFRHETN